MDNNDALTFTTKVRNIQRCLKQLREKDIIGESVYLDFYLQSWRAKTIRDLQDLTHTLAEICQGKTLGQTLGPGKKSRPRAS